MPVLGTVTIDLFIFPFQGLKKLVKQTIGLLFYNLIKFSSLQYSLDLSVLMHPTRYIDLFQSVRNKTCVTAYTMIVAEY